MYIADPELPDSMLRSVSNLDGAGYLMDAIGFFAEYTGSLPLRVSAG